MNDAPESHATNRTPRVIIALGLAAFLVGIAVPAGLLTWEAMSPTVIMREGAAGTLLSTHVHPGAWFANTLTRVDTSTGNVMVQGSFSGTRGSPLAVVQLNKLRKLRLCIAGATTECAPLAGVWAGRLTPIAPARHTFDFQRFGMTTNDLADSIGLGVIAVALVALLGLLMRIGCDDDDDACTDKEPAT